MVSTSTTFQANRELLRALATSLANDLARVDAPRDAVTVELLRERLRALQTGLARHFEREHQHWQHVNLQDPSTQRWIRLQSGQHVELDARLRSLDEELAQRLEADDVGAAKWCEAARAIRAMTFHQLSDERLFQQTVLDDSYVD